MKAEERVYGILAGFEDHHRLLQAAEKAHAEGYRCMEAYSPFPVEDLASALGHKHTLIPLLVLLGGVVGCFGGYALAWYAMAVDYPLNVGGKPLNSWPMFIPITFELTVLVAALCAFLGSLAMNRLPEPYHPLFNSPEFARATRDRFFLCIESRDPKFEPERTRRFLEALGPYYVQEVHNE